MMSFFFIGLKPSIVGLFGSLYNLTNLGTV
jgi:hypothetical protein